MCRKSNKNFIKCTRNSTRSIRNSNTISTLIAGLGDTDSHKSSCYYPLVATYSAGKGGIVLNPADRTYINGKLNSSYHAECRLADLIINQVKKQINRKGRSNFVKLRRKLRKYTIIVYRGDGRDSAPCKMCTNYLRNCGFRNVICYKDGELVKINIQTYYTEHLSYSQVKMLILIRERHDHCHYDHSD